MANKNNPDAGVKVQASNLDAFPLRMKLLIEHFGSAAEIARRCGFSEAVVRSWRDGNSDPSRERCLALAKGTGASPAWIIGGIGPMWISELGAAERDTYLIALGDPDDPDVQAAEARRDAAITSFSAGVRAQQEATQTAPQSQSHALRRDVLKVAVQLAEEALDGRTLVPADYAELVDLIYDALANGLPSAQVLAFARPAARGIGLRGDEDANPVDRPGAPVAGAGK